MAYTRKPARRKAPARKTYTKSTRKTSTRKRAAPRAQTVKIVVEYAQPSSVLDGRQQAVGAIRKAMF